jgi:hypothetical protein
LHHRIVDSFLILAIGVYQGTSSSSGDLRIIKEFHRWLRLLLRLQNGCGFVDPFGDFHSAPNNIWLAQGGAAVACRRHGLEVEAKGNSKILL